MLERIHPALFVVLFFHFYFSQESPGNRNEPTIITRMYLASVQDSFSIYQRLPKEYTTEKSRKFTTIYLLDADMYFDSVVTIVEKYKEIGMMPPVILVGIGYGSFGKMEKLRSRDLLYLKGQMALSKMLTAF